MIIFSGAVHVTIAAILGYITYKTTGFHYGFIIWAAIGSLLLPDLDHPNSTLGKFNPFTIFMKHHGIMHSIVPMILFCIIIGYARIEAEIMLGIGYFSHLIMDKNVNLIYPFKI